MTSIEFYKRSTIIKRIKDNLNQINQGYFEGNHGILSVTDNGDYVTVKTQGLFVANYDIQKLWGALENFSKEDREFLFPYDLWDYLDHCKYTPEDQESDNELKTEKELTFSEKRQVALVDMLCETAPTAETVALSDEIDNLKNQLMVLSETVTQLCIRVYKLEGENKQLKNNQLEVETKSETEPKPTVKKRPKFKLPENFADYQQECDNLINDLSYFYNIKKGKWNGNILQFILTPTDTQKAKHLYPDKWKAGLYLQPGQWRVDKVSLSDPDSWEDWFMDINDFADANDIEIS
jgi:hypothetical protein